MERSFPIRKPRLFVVLLGLCLLTSAVPAAAQSQVQPLTVAFIGDQGMSGDARAVLQMIKQQGADMVLHQGDLSYRNDPESWDAMITDILGADFPYFAVVGNHDTDSWYGPNGYQARLRARLDRVAGATCSGDLGVRSACTYRGLFFILSGIGTIPDNDLDDPGHIAFIREQLAATTAAWRICSWHKNQNAMQLGEKADEVGWQAYETCREGGAIVATAHEHSYSRTFLMDDFETQSIASKSRVLRVKEGETFAFVSGLGGSSIRGERRDGAWWADRYTKVQGADYGALFCTFNANGDANRAQCHFRDIRGRVVDQFEIVSAVKQSRNQVTEQLARERS